MTYFEMTEEHIRQAHMKFCPKSSMIHTQMHSHQDSRQLENFACLLQSPVIIKKTVEFKKEQDESNYKWDHMQLRYWDILQQAPCPHSPFICTILWHDIQPVS